MNKFIIIIGLILIIKITVIIIFWEWIAAFLLLIKEMYE